VSARSSRTAGPGRPGARFAERHSNGYKQYGVSYLVRLLRVKRLVDLGFSLSQIAAMGDDDHHPAEALCALDAGWWLSCTDLPIP
jgi:hypothetical protein